MDNIKVALIQQKYAGSKKETINNTIEYINKASANGAKLVALQELHTSEYFCKSEDSAFFDYSFNFEEEIDIFASIARKCNIVLVSSLFERRTAGIYHNTAVVFDTDGSIAGKYRKMHIPDDPLYYEKFYFTQGDLGFTPIQTSLGRLGVLICWDQWFPEAARIMALNGAEILIYPTAIGYIKGECKKEHSRQKKAWITIQRSHAIANGIPLLSINRVGKEKDGKTKDEIIFWGNSFVCGPQGEILAKCGDKEGILYADIDFKRSEEVRRMWPFFRDRRIDSYSDLLCRYKN